MPAYRPSRENAALIRLPFLVLLLLAIAIVSAADLVLDAPASWLTLHVIVDLSIVLLCLAATGYLWRGWRRTQQSLGKTRLALGERQAERDAWRTRAQKLLNGLEEAIDEQMRQWELTAAERETALLLLKGYSHKEIAALSERSEKTARQHSGVVYRKSGLSGRAELAAFFLEDLLLPMPETEPDDMAPDQR